MNRKVKCTIAGLLLCSMINVPSFAAYEWANDGIEYCRENGIMQGDENGNLNPEANITREQMAKMLIETFNITDEQSQNIQQYIDVTSDRWSFGYINTFSKFVIKQDIEFRPSECVTRQEFAAYLVLASGLKESNIRNYNILDENFNDFSQVDPDYKKLLCIAVERGYMKGSDELLRPNDLLTRAEVCTLLYRVRMAADGKLTLDLGVRKSETSIKGKTEIPLLQAKQWAKNMNAHQRFIDIADLYWKYGEITGIRPEILYAQAAKETNFGKYTGAVRPEQNNWAGIKTGTATGDTTEDHETFATAEDGVKAHYNHMSAYIGLDPVGTPHARYYIVSRLTWAGTVVNVEDLGGRWCPDLYYGYSIMHNYIEPMSVVQITDIEEYINNMSSEEQPEDEDEIGRQNESPVYDGNFGDYTSLGSENNENVKNEENEIKYERSETPIKGIAQVSCEQAKKWAESMDAHQRFIDIADLYWKYGEITGIRPEILYAQAAKETHYGKYTGIVQPEQNNWAGIKKGSSNGDTADDHETFATAEEGVKAHYNHMSAYLGLDPVGTPHDRYFSIVKMPWAGTVVNVEDLGGKWSPNKEYGYSILHDFLKPMMAVK